MELTSLVCILVFVFAVSVSPRKFPSFIPRCNRNDPSKCFIKTVNEIRPYLVKGIPELNIPPLDPLILPKISVANYTGSSLGVDAEFSNMTFFGGKNFVIKNHTQDFDKMECYTELYIPKLDLVTQYRIKGRLLILNIDSTGKAEASFGDLTIKAGFKMKSYQKNGKEHLKFDTKEFEVEIGKAKMHLDDIFPNNPTINENTNNVINENIDSLIKDIKPIVEKTSKDIVLDLLNRVYDLYSFDELWLEI